MQGVFTKILQLWIPNKTDKGTVVTDVFEPNFTKLDQYAETTNQTLTNLNNNKLDKGTYNGKADDLDKAKLDKGTYTKTASDLDNSKYNKTGGKLTGTVVIDTAPGLNLSRTEFYTGGVQKGYVGRIEDTAKAYTGFHNYISGKYLRTFDDGSTEIGADNLNTPTKEVIAAINEELKFIENSAGRKIGDLFYIQNVGTKILGQYYFDKNTYGLYKCLNTTTSTNNDSNFVDDSNFAIALLARNNQTRLTNLETTSYLYSGDFTGAGTHNITNILNYRMIQMTIVLSTSSTITTHDQYTVCFSPITRYLWGTQNHALGTIALSVSAGYLVISGTAAANVRVREIYGIGKN